MCKYKNYQWLIVNVVTYRINAKESEKHWFWNTWIKTFKFWKTIKNKRIGNIFYNKKSWIWRQWRILRMNRNARKMVIRMIKINDYNWTKKYLNCKNQKGVRRIIIWI